jgi:hypothetical protein
MKMNKTNQVALSRYQFSWVNKRIERRRLKVQLTDFNESKKKSRHEKGRLRRFLVRLRSD